VVFEEGEENFSFPEFQPVTHGRLGLRFQCLFDVEVKTFQDEDFFLSSVRGHFNNNKWQHRVWAVQFDDFFDGFHHVLWPDTGMVGGLGLQTICGSNTDRNPISGNRS
jgi:hypothetical protein